jgi:HAD superfamily hydrolase (TIGR01509 family)
MIRNIVFDLGNVLISFGPSEYLKRKKYPEKLRRKILSDIFQSSEWLMLDNGIIDLEEAVRLISEKSSLKREEIARIFNKRTEIMFPLEDNVRMLPELKKQGFKLYYLSNFPLDIFGEIRNKYSFFNYLDGGIISAEVRFSKPDPEIFRIFLEKYSLDPSESVFIDDIEANIISAWTVGMRGFFTRGASDFSSEFLRFLKDSPVESKME